MAVARKLCDTYADSYLTLDWIYLGDSSGLRASLADAIRAIQRVRGKPSA